MLRRLIARNSIAYSMKDATWEESCSCEGITLIAYDKFTSTRYALICTLSIYLPTIFFSKNLAGI